MELRVAARGVATRDRGWRPLPACAEEHNASTTGRVARAHDQRLANLLRRLLRPLSGPSSLRRCMAPPPDRQVSLAKFFGMPNGGQKEDRQVRLDGMFKKQAAKLNGHPEGDAKLETVPDAEMEEAEQGTATKKRAADERPAHGDERPEKKVKAVDDEDGSPPVKGKGKGKAPKVLDSDSEAEAPKTNGTSFAVFHRSDTSADVVADAGKSVPKPVKMHPMFAKPPPKPVPSASEASGSEAPLVEEDAEVEEESVASDEDGEVAGRMADLVDAGKEPAGIAWEKGKPCVSAQSSREVLL